MIRRELGTFANLEKVLCCCLFLALQAGCTPGQAVTDSNVSHTEDEEQADACEELESLEQELEAMRLKFTNRHPGIIELQKQIRCASAKCSASKNETEIEDEEDWCREDIIELIASSLRYRIRAASES